MVHVCLLLLGVVATLLSKFMFWNYMLVLCATCICFTYHLNCTCILDKKKTIEISLKALLWVWALVSVVDKGLRATVYYLFCRMSHLLGS